MLFEMRSLLSKLAEFCIEISFVILACHSLAPGIVTVVVLCVFRFIVLSLLPDFLDFCKELAFCLVFSIAFLFSALLISVLSFIFSLLLDSCLLYPSLGS